jgi:hypothetical protein
MSEKNEKVFRGVWVPAEIWETHTLSWMEKSLWAEISSLGTEEKPCFASNAYLAAKFNSTESSISNMISKLKSLGMVKQVSYDGRSRKMVAILPKETSPTSEVRVHPQVKSDSTHRLNIDTSVGASVDTSPIVPFNDELPLSQGASAQPTESDDSCSRPPQHGKANKVRGSRKSPPTKKPVLLADDAYFAKLAEIYPHLDMEKESKAMDAWLLSRPHRPKSQAFAANWINRAAERYAEKNNKDNTPRLPNGEIDWANVKPNE